MKRIFLMLFIIAHTILMVSCFKEGCFNIKEKNNIVNVNNVDKNEILPIGSVVLLKDSTKEVMIIGYCQIELATGDMWDYAGSLYPEGYMGADKVFLFNREQIDKISFIGYDTDEYIEIKGKVDGILGR